MTTSFVLEKLSKIMPELPEVETSVRAIQDFSGRTLKSILISNPNLRWPADTVGPVSYTHLRAHET